MYRLPLVIFVVVGAVCAFDLSNSPHGDAEDHGGRQHLRQTRSELPNYYEYYYGVNQRHNARKEAVSPVTPHPQIPAPYPDWLTNQKEPKEKFHTARQSQSRDVYATLSSSDSPFGHRLPHLFPFHKPNGDHMTYRPSTEHLVPHQNSLSYVYEDKPASEPCLYSPCPTTPKPKYMQPQWGYATTVKPVYNYQDQPRQAYQQRGQAYQQRDQAYQQRVQAYQLREQANQQRWQAYQQRGQAYQQRERAHQQRVQGHHQRVQGHHQREQAHQQREQAHQQRVQAHQQRVQAYQQQWQAYQQREQAYQQREQAYQQRVQAYQQREQAHLQRVQAYQQRVQPCQQPGQNYNVLPQTKDYQKPDYQHEQTHQSPLQNQQASPIYPYHQTYYNPYQVQPTYQYQGDCQSYNPYQPIQPDYHQAGQSVPVVSTARPDINQPSPNAGIEKPASVIPLYTSAAVYSTQPVALPSSVDSAVTSENPVAHFTVPPTEFPEVPVGLIGSTSKAELNQSVTEGTEGAFIISTVAPPDGGNFGSQMEIVHENIAEVATIPTEKSKMTEVTSVSSLPASPVDELELVELSTPVSPTALGVTYSEYELLPTTESLSTEEPENKKTVNYGYTTSTAQETYPITEVPVYTTTVKMESASEETVSPYLETNEETTTVGNGNAVSTIEATKLTTERPVPFTTPKFVRTPTEDATKPTEASGNTEVPSRISSSTNSIASTRYVGESSTTVSPITLGMTYSEYELLPTTESLSTEGPENKTTTVNYGYTTSTTQETYPITEVPVYTTTVQMENASEETVSPNLETNEETTTVGNGDITDPIEATDLTTDVLDTFTIAEMGETPAETDSPHEGTQTSPPNETDGTAEEYYTASTVKETVATTEIPISLTTEEKYTQVPTAPTDTVTTSSPPKVRTTLHYTQAPEEISTTLVEGEVPDATRKTTFRQSTGDSLKSELTSPPKNTNSKVRREDPYAKRQSEQRFDKNMSDERNRNMILNDFVDPVRGHTSKPVLEGFDRRFLKKFISLVVKELRQGTVTKQDEANLKTVFGNIWYRITDEAFHRVPVRITGNDDAGVYARALEYLFKETPLARKFHKKSMKVGKHIRVKRETKKPGLEPWQEVILRSILARQPWSNQDERNQEILSAIKEQLQEQDADYEYVDVTDDTTEDDNTSGDL